MASPVHSRQLEGENAHLPGYMHPSHLIIMASKKGTYPTFWIITMIVLKIVLNGNQNYSNLTKPPAKQGGEQNVSSIQFSRSSYLISEVSVCAMYCHLWIFQPSAAQCDKIPAWQSSTLMMAYLQNEAVLPRWHCICQVEHCPAW